MNIRQSQIDQLLNEIRDGKARPGFTEENGNLMYKDSVGTRQVVSLEQRDRVLPVLDCQAAWALLNWSQSVSQSITLPYRYKVKHIV